MLFGLMLWTAAAGTVYAADRTLSVHDRADRYDLAPLLSVYVTDKSGEPVEKIAQKPFSKPSSEVSNLGLTLSAHWFRFTVLNNATENKNWFVELDYSNIRRIRFYAPGEKPVVAGELEPFSRRPIPNRNFVFPVTLPPGEKATYFIEVETLGPTVVPLSFLTPKGFYDRDATEVVLLALWFGSLIVVIVYGAISYLMSWDKIYLPFIVGAMATLFYIFGERGFGLQFIYGSRPWLNYLLRIGCPAITVAAFSFFVIRFLDLNPNFPRWKAIFHLTAGASALVLLLSFFAFNDGVYFVATAFLLAVRFVFPIQVVWVCKRALDRRFKPAAVLRITMIIFLIGEALNLLFVTGVMPFSLFTETLGQFGMLAGVLMTAVTIREKFNYLREEERITYEKYLEVMAVDVRFVTKQKEKLELRVRERTEALNKANEDLNAMLGDIIEKNKIIEEKNHDIIESINYAHRIQTAILPATDYIRLFVPHFSVFYRPKDIVSGDFYWFAYDDVSDRAILAAVDCTGHGVPGAFMSVIGYNLLNRIVIEQGVVDPDAILSELDRQVIFALKQHEYMGEQPNDGMDVALVSIDRSQKQVHFAGANRPFYYFDGSELKIINGDKFPIGGTQISNKKFTAHSIAMKGPEKCYLYTDGYADQFGGPNMKKFSPKRIREWILAHASIPVYEQGRLLEETFDAWKGETEQLDDITIMVFGMEDLNPDGAE